MRRHVSPGLEALADHRRLLIGSPLTAPRRPSDQLDPAISIAFVPVLMHDIIPGTIHRLTCALANSRSFNDSSPRREVGHSHRLPYNWDRPHESLSGLSPIDQVCERADKTPLWDEVYNAYDSAKERIHSRSFR